ncbi:MAG: helix-turn-helix domain-containing protein [Planctomycetota bacterium]
MARLGLKLFYLRTRERKLSQQGVADRLGVRQATLSQIERGKVLPSCALLGELCRFFDVTPTFLLDEERGVLPLPTERWALRNALVSVGMWVEVDPETLVEGREGRKLAPMLEGGEFFDEAAADVLRKANGRPAEKEIAAQRRALAAEESELTRELEGELQQHPRRRKH